MSTVAAGGTLRSRSGRRRRPCAAGPGGQPYQYKVTVTRKVNNIFGGIFGIRNTIVRASATAEYLKPLSMGSPSNQFGNDPDAVTNWPVSASSPPQTYPNFWANIAGGNSTKHERRRVRGRLLRHVRPTAAPATARGKNLDYNPNGYYYTVDFTELGDREPPGVRSRRSSNVGDYCTDGSTNLAGARRAHQRAGYPQGQRNTADWAKRYAPVTNRATSTTPATSTAPATILRFGGRPAADHDVHRAQGGRARPAEHRAAGLPGHVPRLHRRLSGAPRHGRHRARRAGAARDVLPAVGHAVPGHRPGRRRVLHRGLDRPRAARATTGSRCAPRRRAAARRRRSPSRATPTWASTPTSAAGRPASSTSRAYRPRRPATRWC